MDASTLVALISSRICHDLVSPISGINRERREIEGDMREQAMLVADVCWASCCEA